MPRKDVLQIKNFSGGVNSYSDPRDLQENEFQILDNAAVDEQGIIRVSGGLELKNNIDLSDDGVDSILSIAGKGLFSHRTDYIYNISGFNSNLESDGGDTANAWGVVKNDGDGTWAFEQTSSNTTGTTPTSIGGNTSFAINYDEYSAAENYNHGSLTFNNIELKEGTNYILKVNIVSEMPWNYLGSNIPPRIRLYSPTDSLYLHPGVGFTSVSDATHTAICNDNLANFIDHTDGSDGYDVTDNPDAHTWSSGTIRGDGSWTAADNNGILTRAQMTNFDDDTADTTSGDATVTVDSTTPILVGMHVTGTGIPDNTFVLSITNSTTFELTANATASNTDTTLTFHAPYKDMYKQFNSLFGTIDSDGGAVTNGYALKMQGANAGFFHASNTAFTSDLAVVASTEYLFDAFYFTNDEQCQVKITNQDDSYATIWDSGILDANSSWTHVSGNTDYPQPIIFTTPSGCDAIRIEVTVAASGNVAYFAGFNIRKNVYELSKLNDNGIGDILPQFNYPNSWGNEKDGSVNSSSYIPGVGANPHFEKVRKYELPFAIGYGFTDNKFTLVIDNGVWGVAHETGTTVNNIMIDSIEILENNSSTDVGVSSYSAGRGNLIFYNKYNNNENVNDISLYQYKPDNNEYEDITKLHNFPTSTKKSNFNFFKSGSKILFCDESFSDKSLYTFQYNKINKTNELKTFKAEGLNINHLTNSSNNGVDDAEYDALQNWLEIHNNNDAYLSMISQDAYNWFDDGGRTDNDLDTSKLWGTPGKFCQHSTDDDGSTSGLVTIDHDDSNEKFQYVPGAVGFADDEQPYAKYITIPKYDIVQSLTSASRVAKITVDLSHWMLWGYSGLETANGSLYIPKMKIYIDVVHANVISTLDGEAYSGEYQANHHDDTGTNFIATIAEKEVNPHDLTMGYNTEEQSPGTLGYDCFQMDSPSARMWNTSYKRCYNYFNSNELDTNDNRPLRVEFEFPYDFTYTPVGGSATNLTVHVSTGTNFQVRIVPVINEGLDHASQGEIVDRIKGIISESWRIDALKIESWKTTQTSNLSTIFSNIQLNEFAMNMAFSTPSEGEADAWDSDWTPVLTSVDNDGIESAFGQFNFNPVGNTDVTKCPEIALAYDISSPILQNVKLIKCYMNSLRNPNYNLQFIIDVNKKTIKSSSSSHENEAIIENNIIHYQLQSKYLLIPNEIDSYESETGVLSENAISSKKLTATFKTAVVANNTLYAGNVLQDGVRYPDRMLKSPIGKSPLLPSTNFIDVAINDGDEITSLQFYKDRLLQFKKNRLYIISTSEDYEYLQDTIDNVGVQQDSQITMTPYGVAWINERGCYLYDGQKVNNLTDNKIAYKEWKDSESSWEIDEKYGPSIHYLRKEDKLIVYGATDSLENIKENEGISGGTATFTQFTIGAQYTSKQYLRKIGYQFDFQTKSWSLLSNYTEESSGLNEDIIDGSLDGRLRVPSHSDMVTNFAYDENGDSIFLMKPINRIVKWDDNPKQTMGYVDKSSSEILTSTSDQANLHRDFRVITKDYDFGAPSVKKKIHKVYVTFKSTDLESHKERKLIQNQDYYSPSHVGVYYAINGKNTWTEFSETKSDNYGTKGLMLTKAETLTTLASSVSIVDTTISVASATNIKVGDVLSISPASGWTVANFEKTQEYIKEQMLVTSVSGTTIGVRRNYNSTIGEMTETGVVHPSGNKVYISSGDWIVAELKPSSSINNIDSFKLRFSTKKITDATEDENGVPPGFMINDISVIYRTKNVR